MTLTNQPSGTCLEVIDGTVSADSPPVDVPTGSCFASAPPPFTIGLFGANVPVVAMQVAATYEGTRLGSGLMRAFLPQATAPRSSSPTSPDHLHVNRVLVYDEALS